MKEMNLLPEKYLYDKEQRKKRKIYMGLVITFILFLMLSYGGIIYIGYNLAGKISDTDLKIQRLNTIRENQLQVTNNKKLLEERRAILDRIESESIDHHAFFVALKNIVPDEIVLESISHPIGSHYNLIGRAIKPDKIADFMVNLAKIRGIENVMLDYVQYEKGDGIGKFSINFNYQFREGDNNESK